MQLHGQITSLNMGVFLIMEPEEVPHMDVISATLVGKVGVSGTHHGDHTPNVLKETFKYLIPDLVNRRCCYSDAVVRGKTSSIWLVGC